MNELDRRTALGVAAFALLALLCRFAFLGARMFHWDEARVGYLSLQFAATGHYHYQPIVHGPLLFLVNRAVFDVFGASDATARAFVALVGGLLPLAAWLYRDHLDRVETVAFAALLALNPVLLYYGRFMRNDVLVAAFAVTTVGLVLRAHATGRRGYLYAAAFALALAFATKANALLYVFCWLAGLAVVLDHWLLRGRAAGENRLEPAVTWLEGGWDRANGRETPAADAFTGSLRVPAAVEDWFAPTLVAAAVFAVTWTFLFAPRPEIYQASAYPGILNDATAGAVKAFIHQWGTGGKHAYSSFFADEAKVLVQTSFVTGVLAVLGFVSDRYRAGGPRALVTVAVVWALASLLGYPAITDVSGHWSVVHVVVPLVIPAAVGAGLLAKKSVVAFRTDDRVGIALAAVVLLAAVGQVAFVDVQTSYANPTGPNNPLVQYGQPAYDIRPALGEVAAVSAKHRGTDVLFYGSHFAVSSEPSIRDSATPTGKWYNRLPLPWYLARANASVASTTNLATVNKTKPPVVIAEAKHYRAIHETLPGYHEYTYRLTSTDTVIVIFVDESART